MTDETKRESDRLFRTEALRWLPEVTRFALGSTLTTVSPLTRTPALELLMTIFSPAQSVWLSELGATLSSVNLVFVFTLAWTVQPEAEATIPRTNPPRRTAFAATRLIDCLSLRERGVPRLSKL